MTDRLQATLDAIDATNSHDPRQDESQPEALLYGQRMSQELARLFPDAAPELQIAARAQHVERWTLPRASFPEGRTGYLTWRKQLAVHHAQVAGRIMADTGYEDAQVETVGRMLRKEGIKRHADTQQLEDVICFVFLKWYFAPFAAKHSPEKIQRIVEKTARKMSDDARARVLDEFDLPEELAAAFRL